MVAYDELIPRAIQGDQDAYAQLFTALQPIIGQTSWMYFKGGREADDFEANCVAHILMRLHLFRGEARFTTWATRVSINHARQHMRDTNAKRRGFVSLEEPVSESGNITLGNVLASRDMFSGLDIRMDVALVMEKLDGKNRRILQSAERNDCNLKGMMEELECFTEPQMKSRLFRARKEARRVLAEEL